MNLEEAFTRAYDEHADALFRHCYFRVSNKERALELTQDAFMKTWDSVAQGKEIQNYRAFLFRVLNNLIIDEYRKKKSTSLDALLEKEGVTEGSFEDLRTGDLDEEVARLDLARDAQELHVALEKLPPDYRRVVVMRFIDQLGPKEIADELNESENTVSVRINRAVKKLQTLMQEEERI